MIKHINSPNLSVKINIVGTANVCLSCIQNDVKLVYISTDYVYPGTNGNYKETDPLFPVNHYAWSKLGGECAVQLYENSLILRVCMTERPFVHKKALVDSKKNLMYIDEAAGICFANSSRERCVKIWVVPLRILMILSRTKDLKYRRYIEKIFWM